MCKLAGLVVRVAPETLLTTSVSNRMGRCGQRLQLQPPFLITTPADVHLLTYTCCAFLCRLVALMLSLGPPLLFLSLLLLLLVSQTPPHNKGKLSRTDRME